MSDGLIIAALALAAGLCVGWLVWGRAVALLRQDSLELANLKGASAAREKAHADQLDTMKAQFGSLAGDVLAAAQGQFLTLADERFAKHSEVADKGLAKTKADVAELIAPMRDTLKRYEERLGEVETARKLAYGELTAQLANVMLGQQSVSREAANLVSALRSSGKTAGSWGEQQLRNTLEMAGLREGIDFTLQAHAAGEDGGKRPDAIIRLPGGRELIVDSKCSMKDYLAAGEAGGDEETRGMAMKRHALAVRAHAKGLSDKAYWNEWGKSADFVVMFMPGENFLSAALEHDLALLGWTFEQRILLCGPINLLAVAKIVALIWRQEKLAEEAQAIGDAGGDLYAALATMTERLTRVGGNLDSAVRAYDDMVASLEGNVLPKARRLKDLGVKASAKTIPDLAEIGKTTRRIAKPELLAPVPAALPKAANAAE